MVEENLRKKADKIAEEKIAFYVHLSAYIMVNLFLVVVWWFSGGSEGIFPWFIFPLFGWGIGIVAHGVESFTAGSYKEKLAEKEYQKLKSRKK